MKFNFTFWLAVTALASVYPSPGEAKEYFVAPNGRNSDAGSSGLPFKTIQYGVDQLEAGDSLLIREGTYHESVYMHNVHGTSDEPILIRNYQNENVIIDGTEDIDLISENKWTRHSGKIFKRTLQKNVTQLFVDGRYQIIARWPNANTHPADQVVRKKDDWEAEDGSWWSKTTWAYADMPGTTVDGNVETNPAYHNLAATGLSFQGGSVILALVSQGPGNSERRINFHESGTGTFTHNRLWEGPASMGYSHSKTYFIEHLNALDQAEEWYYINNTLYLWADDGKNPKKRNVRGRTTSHAFDFKDCDHITIKGLNFFASNFKTDWDKTSTNIRVEDCHLQYPDASRRILGQYPYSPDESDYQTSLRGSYNALINSTIKYSEHGAILFSGDGTEAHNNLFHHTAISGIGYTAAILQVNKFTRNTVYITGTRAVVKTNANPQGNRIQTHNLIDGWGYQQVLNDGSALQCNSKKSTGTVRAYNWFMNSYAYGSRWDGHTGSGGLNHHQVAYRVNGAMQIKGDNHDTHSNTCIESWDKNDFIILAEPTKDGGGIENENSRLFNNVGDKIAGHRSKSLDDYPIPGDHSHNFNGYISGSSAVDQLRDPNNCDFRPKQGSEIIDTGKVIPGVTDSFQGNAPDQGAYEFGDTNYWIPGRQTERASAPVPPNGAENVKLDADLMFLEGIDAASHDIYLGTSPTDLSFRGNQKTNVFGPPSNLDGDTVYYWRVDEVREKTRSIGTIFRFRTENTTDGNTYKFLATADTFVNPKRRNKNYGSIGRLRVGANGRYTLIKFDVQGVTGSIISARLRIKTHSAVPNLQVYAVDGEWEEHTLTAKNYDLSRGAELHNEVDLVKRTWYSLNVTSLVSGDGTFSFQLEVKDTRKPSKIYGRESGFTPELHIESE